MYAYIYSYICITYICVYGLKPEAAFFKITLIKYKPRVFTIAIVYLMDTRHFAWTWVFKKELIERRLLERKTLRSAVSLMSSQLTYHLTLTSK